ncbi:MAG: hypothetical protein HWN81_15375 [Candidatus Lokiarchaeota archaeon]|nr:hypothetical protein [Candidatus Lokiarchaeota archaeon]
MFDLTRLKTYEEIEQWLSEMFEIMHKKIPFIVIGNKLDLVKEVSRSVDFNIVRDYAETQDSIYIETSAKTGENVEEAFKELTRRIVKHVSEK